MLTEQQLIEQLDGLVRCKSLTGDFAENKKAIDLVVSLLPKKAIVKRLLNEGTEILLASNVDTLQPEIGYMVHIDVVAAPDEMFKVTREGDILRGRGVSDMKFSIPLGIALLTELIEQKSKISFTLCITSDEEIGGFAGGAWLANTFGWKPETLLVPDGGDELRFVEAGKGVCQIQVTSRGLTAHASRVWLGNNAIPPLAQLVVKLNELYQQNNQQEGWVTTLNFGQFHAGISTNQVCDEAVLKIDLRYPETDSIANIEAQVKKLAEEIDPTLEIKLMSTGLPVATDVKLPIVKKFIAAVEAGTGEKIRLMKSHGASDARHFAQFQTPTLILKPHGGDIHAPTEWISVKSTLGFYQGLRQFLNLT